MIARRSPVVLVLLVALAACGASQREKTLKATYTTLNAVSDGVVAYSKVREDRIIDVAASEAEGAAQLETFRESVDKLVAKLAAAYRLLAAAAVLEDDKISIATVTAAALAVQQAWADLQQTGSP